MLSTFSSARNLYSRNLMALARAYSGGCPKESSCRFKEPGCLTAFTVCDSIGDDPCNPKPVCCGSARLTRDPCYNRRSTAGDSKYGKQNGNEIPTKSVWEYPADCCGNPCPELLPRFDTLYYTLSDKDKRDYQQTWVEYKVVTKTRDTCNCYAPTELPPIYRRDMVRCPDTACEYDSQKLKELCCLSQPTQCARTTMPCCRPANVPPKCIHLTKSKNCKKKCCPYPAFSECCHPCLQRSPFSECTCLKFRQTCEGYAALRRKLRYGLPPNLPEWPPKLIGPRY